MSIDTDQPSAVQKLSMAVCLEIAVPGHNPAGLVIAAYLL